MSRTFNAADGPGSPPETWVRNAAGTAGARPKETNDMAMGRMEIEQEPGVFISGTRARWLIQAGRARVSGAGKLQMLAPTADDGGRPKAGVIGRTAWSAYSSAGARNYSGSRWLAGYHMNGDAINHG